MGRKCCFQGTVFLKMCFCKRVSGALEKILIAKGLVIDRFAHLAVQVKGLGGKLPDRTVVAQ